MFRFRMEIAGQAQLDFAIGRFGNICSDFRPVWDVVAEDFYEMEQQQFATQGAAGSGGTPWAPLKKDYAEWKQRHYGNLPILQRRGDLMQSLTYRDASGSVFIAEPKALTLGSTVPYGIYHQSPAERQVGKDGKPRLPRRPEIQFTKDFKVRVQKHIQVYLVNMAKQLGFYQRREEARARQAASFRRALGMFPPHDAVLGL